MACPLRITPTHPNSAASGNTGLRKSSTSWKLTSLADEDDAQQMLLREEEEHAQALEDAKVRKRTMIWRQQKPPRHASVPMCAQILLKLWQHELQRKDVSITSDFFYDLDGTEEQGIYLVERMQTMGFNISVRQFLSLQRCSIYTVLLVAL